MTRVTIIGGGYGGITIAKALDDVAEVTLVEQKDTFVNHAAALRAAVDRQWAERSEEHRLNPVTSLSRMPSSA